MLQCVQIWFAIMSENKAMKVESSSTYYQPPIVPKPSGPERKNHSQSKKRKKNSHEEKEPLFVIDKTRNTKLQYEVITLLFYFK